MSISERYLLGPVDTRAQRLHHATKVLAQEMDEVLDDGAAEALVTVPVRVCSAESLPAWEALSTMFREEPAACAELVAMIALADPSMRKWLSFIYASWVVRAYDDEGAFDDRP